MGDGGFRTALQRRFLSLLAKITTMKSVPVEDCVGTKAEWKYSFRTGERRRIFVASFFYMMLTAPQMSLDRYEKMLQTQICFFIDVLCIVFFLKILRRHTWIFSLKLIY